MIGTSLSLELDPALQVHRNLYKKGVVGWVSRVDQFIAQSGRP